MELYKKAIQKWGKNSQLEMVIEECAELIQAIQKYKRNVNFKTIDNICEEVADVEIMIEQMRVMYDTVIIDEYKKKKLKRLSVRVGCYQPTVDNTTSPPKHL